MSSIMSQICLVTRKLYTLELLKITVLKLVSMIENQFLSQSGPNLHEVFMGTRSRMSSIMSKIRPVTRKLFALEWWKIAVFNLFGTIDLISQSVWIKVDNIYLVTISI